MCVCALVKRTTSVLSNFDKSFCDVIPHKDEVTCLFSVKINGASCAVEPVATSSRKSSKCILVVLY